MHNFKTGDTVVCVMNDAREDVITDQKAYHVLDTGYDYITVHADTGKPVSFIPERFELLKSADPESVFAFDVDDTLVMWSAKMPEKIVCITNPYSGEDAYLMPNKMHINLLKEMHGRGRYILVWSQRGVKWAQAVVTALGLTGYVHTYMTKPMGYVDDLPAEKWLGNRIYLGDGENE